MRRLSLFIFLCCATSAQANIGRIKSTDTGVTIIRGAQALEAKPGVVLEAGDIIKTPAKGKVGMTFVDNSRVSLSKSTVVKIERFIFDDTTHDGNFVLNLTKGAVAVVSGQISRSGSKNMLIRTPKSLYALRDAKTVVRVK